MFASKKYAQGVCDMCGQVFMLKALKTEINNQRPTGFLVCVYCLDEDNPQLQLGRAPIIDPQALFNPRPDVGRDSSRNMWGWSPVGNVATQLEALVGRVSVNGVRVQ